MRLFNFSILAGPKVTVSDVTTTEPSPYLVVSGSIGTDIKNLDRSSNNQFYAFATHFGDDTDENPYGNTSFYNVGRINTSTALELTQSLGVAQITGSAEASFLFIVENNFRG